MTSPASVQTTFSSLSAQARFNMIEGQLRPNGIRDERILSVMETMSRELFVPPVLAGVCYVDDELTVVPGHRILRPLVTARLIQSAEINQDDVVLDIAGASGYSAAILVGMAKKVVALESDDAIADGMRQTLASVDVTGVKVVAGKLREGCKAEGPFDVIIINGGVEEIPNTLFDQLAEGGRLVTVFRRMAPANAAHTGELRVYKKVHSVMAERSVIDATASLLPEFAQAKVFTFE